MFRPCALAAAVACAAAQDWGTVGSWELVVPTPVGGNVASPLRAYHHACSVPGYLVIAGNDTTQPGGAGDLYLYNIPANTWSAPFDYMPWSNAGVRAPFVFAQGGYVALVDETGPNALYYIDASLPTGPWSAVAVSGAPAARVAQRFLSWGSTLYMFGGFDTVALTQNNDLFSLDLNAAIQGTPQTWVTVSPPAVAGVVPNYPPSRVGYSWTGYQVCCAPPPLVETQREQCVCTLSSSRALSPPQTYLPHPFFAGRRHPLRRPVHRRRAWRLPIHLLPHADNCRLPPAHACMGIPAELGQCQGGQRHAIGGVGDAVVGCGRQRRARAPGPLRACGRQHGRPALRLWRRDHKRPHHRVVDVQPRLADVGADCRLKPVAVAERRRL